MRIDKFKRIKTEGVQRQKKQYVNPKLEESFLPVRKNVILELSEIIDLQAIQSLMEDFYKYAHITMALVDLKGNVLVSVGWQDICTKFHRVHPETFKHCVESDTNLSKGVSPGEIKLYKCKNNMWDIVTPIIVNDQHIGNIFSGQFFFEDEPPDYEIFISQAKKYGFNEKEYIAALEKVQRLSRENVNTGMTFLAKLANVISQLSYSNIKLSQSLAERDSLVKALQESEKRERVRSNELAAVLDAVPVAVYIAHDPQAIQITGNLLSYEWLQVPIDTNLSKSAPEGKKPEMFKLSKDGVEILPANMPSQIAAAGIEVNDCELEIVSADGKTRHVLGNARPLHDEQGNIRGSVSAFIDITERKKAEKALKKAHDNLEKKIKKRTNELEETYKSLKESEKGLAEAQKIAQIGSWDWNLKTNKMYWSNEMYRILGKDLERIDSSYNEILSCVHPEDRDYLDNVVKRALNGNSFGIDHRIILASSEERFVHAQGNIIFDEKNIPSRMRGTIQDITERKRSEEKIQNLANIVESSNDAIITISLKGTVNSWNKSAEQIYGYSAKEILGKKISLLEPDHLKGEIKQLIEKVKQGVKIQRYETERLKMNGKVINVSITLSPVFDVSGKLVAISAIIRDITERIKSEKLLAKAEDARKKEIHHRIKNNLQVICSLLDLQAEKFRDETVLEAFRESQNRVLSMSLIHEELYKGKETNTLDFSIYLQKLAKNLFQTYSFNSKDIHLYLDLEENALLDIDTAVPLGIIVNELVSNSLKHAFQRRNRGEILIKLHRERNIECRSEYFNTYVLSVSDNGIGIPENLNIKDLDSLGMQLVTSLVDQLDGELELRRDNGTEFNIKFMVTENNNSVSVPTI